MWAFIGLRVAEACFAEFARVLGRDLGAMSAKSQVWGIAWGLLVSYRYDRKGIEARGGEVIIGR